MNASDWLIWIPEDLCVSGAEMVPFDKGDIVELANGERGEPNLDSVRGINNNRAIEQYRNTNFSESGLTLRLPEDFLRNFAVLSGHYPLLAVQRRFCPDWEIIEHYGRISLGPHSLSSPTASGVNVSDGVPIVTVPSVFGKKWTFTRALPLCHIRLEATPISATFCDPYRDYCQSGCLLAFGLWSDDVLQISYDGGHSWQDAPVILPGDYSGTPQMIFCAWGRLFLGTSEKWWYTDNPADAIPDWVTIDSSALGDSLLTMSRSGTILYALYDNGVGRGIARSQDLGKSWQDSGLPIANYEYLDSSHSVVITTLGTDIVLSKDRGSNWENHTVGNLLGVSVSTPDYRRPTCPIIRVATDEGVFESYNLQNFVQISSILSTTDVYLNSFADGWGMWFSAKNENDDEITMKFVGDDCWVDLTVGQEKSVRQKIDDFDPTAILCDPVLSRISLEIEFPVCEVQLGEVWTVEFPCQIAQAVVVDIVGMFVVLHFPDIDGVALCDSDYYGKPTAIYRQISFNLGQRQLAVCPHDVNHAIMLAAANCM